jgi:hypothetical protein
MLTRITAAYADTSAAQLSLGLGLPALDAYAELTVPLAEGALELRLLGNSHQVVLRTPTVECSEAVACLPQHGGGLPERADHDWEGSDYVFRSTVCVRDAATLAAEARRLVAEYQDQAAALVGVFPGSPHAVTAIAVRPMPSGVGWRTWHLYPQTGEVVTTTSKVRRR